MPQQDKIVNVPGRGDVSFPDTMSIEEITAAIKKNLPSAKPAGKDAKGSMTNFASTILSPFKPIGEELGRFKQGAVDTAKSIYHNPLPTIGKGIVESVAAPSRELLGVPQPGESVLSAPKTAKERVVGAGVTALGGNAIRMREEDAKGNTGKAFEYGATIPLLTLGAGKLLKLLGGEGLPSAVKRTEKLTSALGKPLTETRQAMDRTINSVLPDYQPVVNKVAKDAENWKSLPLAAKKYYKDNYGVERANPKPSDFVGSLKAWQGLTTENIKRLSSEYGIYLHAAGNKIIDASAIGNTLLKSIDADMAANFRKLFNRATNFPQGKRADLLTGRLTKTHEIALLANMSDTAVEEAMTAWALKREAKEYENLMSLSQLDAQRRKAFKLKSTAPAQRSKEMTNVDAQLEKARQQLKGIIYPELDKVASQIDPTKKPGYIASLQEKVSKFIDIDDALGVVEPTKHANEAIENGSSFFEHGASMYASGVPPHTVGFALHRLQDQFLGGEYTQAGRKIQASFLPTPRFGSLSQATVQGLGGRVPAQAHSRLLDDDKE